MVERSGGQCLEVQVQKPFDPEISTFCYRYTSINTQRAYRRDLDAFSHFATGVGVVELGQLTVGHIDEYLRNCREKGLSSATIRRGIAPLSGLLRRAGMEEFAKAAREISIKYIGNTQEVQPFSPLSSEEVGRLREVSQGNSRDAAFIAIALGTGANVTEILALRTNDMLEVDGQISIRFGSEHERMIELDSEASEIVRKHKADSQEHTPLFTKGRLDKKGKKSLSRQWVSLTLKEYGKSIGRPDLNPRVLRQTFIVNVQTNDPKELAELLGIDEFNATRALHRRRLTQQIPQSGILFEATTK